MTISVCIDVQAIKRVNGCIVIIILLMSTLENQFFVQSPNKILEKADIYSKTLDNFHQLPLATNKSNLVRRKAQQHRNNIEYSIQQSQYQNDLFRRKEKQDLATREKYEKKIQHSLEKNSANGKQIEKKLMKNAERYEKHLKQVYTKYDQGQKKHREQEKQQAQKLRKELGQFYQKQQERKKKAEHSQIHVGTCYQAAVDRINNIHKKNEEYAQKAEKSLNLQLSKNNHFQQRIRERRRSLSSCNRRKLNTYRHSMEIFQTQQLHFIQKYANNQDASLKAWKHIDQECGKTKKRLGEFFKKRLERWSTDKKRVDQAKEQISQRCTNILQKTVRASFIKTSSSLRQTAQQRTAKVQQKKASIIQKDELQKDKIMQMHLDLRLKKESTCQINDRMQVMRLQAKKLSSTFL